MKKKKKKIRFILMKKISRLCISYMLYNNHPERNVAYLPSYCSKEVIQFLWSEDAKRAEIHKRMLQAYRDK
jgi:hypothetical protein